MSETAILPLLEVNQGQHNWSTQITFQEVLQALGCHFNNKESRTPGPMEFELRTFQVKHVQPKGNRQTSDQVPNQRSKFHASPLGRIHDFQSSYRPWPSEVRWSTPSHKEMRKIKKPDMKMPQVWCILSSWRILPIVAHLANTSSRLHNNLKENLRMSACISISTV